MMAALAAVIFALSADIALTWLAAFAVHAAVINPS